VDFLFRRKTGNMKEGMKKEETGGKKNKALSTLWKWST